MRAHVLLSVAALCAGGRQTSDRCLHTTSFARHTTARPPRDPPRQTSVRRTPPDFRAAQAHVLLSVAALCAGGRRPARDASLTARNDRSRGPPWPCRRPPAPQPHSPAGLAPPSSRATMTTGTAATIPADHTPPTSRAAAHRHRRKLAPQVLSGTKLSLINTSAEATGQNSPCSS